MKVILILILIIVLILIFFKMYKKERSKQLYEYLENFVKDVDRYNTIFPRKVIKIPVYYINMDKSTDRNEWMKKQMVNVERYYRVPAVNGYKIKNKKHDVVDGVEFYNQFDLTLPEIGCTLSHLKAIKIAYENGEEMVIIMEDDIYMDMMNLMDYSLETLIENAPDDWEIIKLVNHSQVLNKSSTYKEHSFHFYDRNKPAYSSGAYVINRKGMETFLRTCGANPYYLMNQKSGVTDTFLWQVSKQVYILEPCVVTHLNTKLNSTIHDEDTHGHLRVTKTIFGQYKEKVLSKQIKFSKVLIDMDNILKKYKQPYFLTCGTLLGFVRENKFIEHDEDIDFGIFSDDLKVNIDDILSNGVFSLKHKLGKPELGYELSFTHKELQISIDLFVYYKTPEYYWNATYFDLCNQTPNKMCRWKYTPFELQQISFLGRDFLIPANEDLFLTESYGKDWMTPKKFSYTEGLSGLYTNLIKEDFTSELIDV